MREFKLQIVTPDGIVYDGAATSITVHTDDGDAQFLAGHVDYMGSVGTGRTRIILPDGKVREASTSGGFLSVSHGEVKLVAVTFEFREDIDLDRAKAAKEKAEKALTEAKDRRSEEIAEAKLLRALNRISVGESR